VSGHLRIIVGITGASGSIYGWRLLEKLRAQPAVETHLIMSRSGERTAFLEMGKPAADFKALAHFHYPVEDIGCRLASETPAPSVNCSRGRQASWSPCQRATAWKP